jgi:hypothetical protein
MKPYKFDCFNRFCTHVLWYQQQCARTGSNEVSILLLQRGWAQLQYTACLHYADCPFANNFLINTTCPK